MIVAIPKDDSAKLPSRGQLSVHGTLNGYAFQTVLEPDGRFSHWMRISDDIQKSIAVKTGDAVEVEVTTLPTWPEPVLPEDFRVALHCAPEKVRTIWHEITPMARWEWIR